MNTYRIVFRESTRALHVEADEFVGYQSNQDTFDFKVDSEVVCSMPKEKVAYIVLVDAITSPRSN